MATARRVRGADDRDRSAPVPVGAVAERGAAPVRAVGGTPILPGWLLRLWVTWEWFRDLGYEAVRWTQWQARAGLFLIGWAVAGLFLGGNALLAARAAGRSPRLWTSLTLAQAIGATATSGPPASPPGGDPAALIRQAYTHYRRAQEAIRRRDWAAYGAEIEALGRVLEALRQTVGGR